MSSRTNMGIRNLELALNSDLHQQAVVNKAHGSVHQNCNDPVCRLRTLEYELESKISGHIESVQQDGLVMRISLLPVDEVCACPGEHEDRGAGYVQWVVAHKQTCPTQS